ncbi:ABC transporter ATP-binding protein [Candidatus Thioglobus autotrophicus]|uniref:ABC transporter ATP-binding protein n=1 Tax=Candidatus Thioglobus autotrophicus TaxID=1705394 RepID=UPI00299E7C84|nr:ABC transporter ATP-binding protein [Candidatus Thioglobus autotrophicus]WPE15962.1 ABC transporter ATP-binding protein [Candidatus Thioglobus autotrophicus]
MNNFKHFLNHLSKRRIKQLVLLLFLMIIASILEVISLSAVLPFLSVLTAPEQVFQHEYAQPLISALTLREPIQLILPITILFIIAVLVAGIVRLLLLYVMTRLSYAIGADLSINIYRRTLYQPYATHVARNSSEVINSIITKTNIVISGILTPLLTLVSSIFILIGIVAVLFAIDIGVALSASIGFGLLYWLVIRYTKNHLKNNSQIIADQSTQMLRSLQEGLGGVRDVLIDGTQEFYCQLYRNADLPLRRASGSNLFIGGSPRYIMEAIGMTLIAGIAYMLTQKQGGMAAAIPVLGALALGAQKLLPVLQQAYGSYSTIKGSKSSFEDVLCLLDQPLPEYENQPTPKVIQFDKEIKLTNLSFRYTQESPWILKNINLSLKKGSHIGFIGSTGSGKSTLLDIIMGLLPATEGDLFIDQQSIDNKSRRSWQMNIAHVPQNIYLSDNSIEENIAFGVSKDKIDHQRVRKAAQQAQIAQLIEQWQEGYQTFVGERGIRLSGGQRQRIGIARALYKKASVLIFDEATSALDNETEREVMEAIKDLGGEITVLIIAHRLTTLRNCDKVVKLGNNYALSIGSYQEMVNK